MDPHDPPPAREEHRLLRALPNAFWRSLALFPAVVITAIGSCTSTARAQETAQTPVVSSVRERPKILTNRRWDEDWSVLADPRITREPLDGLKYIPFSPKYPRTYLSIGLNLRELVEVDHTPFFWHPSGS